MDDFNKQDLSNDNDMNKLIQSHERPLYPPGMEESLDIPDESRNVEIATEITPDPAIDISENKTALGIELNSATGWIAFALSIISFFIMPIILGVAAIIVGFIARVRDAEWLGSTAIVIGIISILLRLFIMPFV